MKATHRSQWTICLMVGLLLVSTAIDAFGDLEEQPVPPSRRNALEVEVAALSVGLSYAEWTWGGWLVGVGIGLGPTYMIDTHSEHEIWGAELGHIRVFASRSIYPWLTIDAGPYFGLNTHAVNGDSQLGLMIGGEVTALVGWRNVKIGPSFQAGWLFDLVKVYGSRKDGYAALTPLNLRFAYRW